MTLAPPEELGAALDALGKIGKRVLIETLDGAVSGRATRLQAAGATIVRDADPCALPKACKNAVELDGIRAAHRRDGAARQPLPRLARRRGAERHAARDRGVRPAAGAAPGDRQAARPLASTPSPAPARTARSCTTAPPQATKRTLEPGSLYLVDSGGQYLDGTTDITRTVAIGTPTAGDDATASPAC